MNTRYTNIRVLVARSIEAVDDGQCDDVREFDTFAAAKDFAKYALTATYQQSALGECTGWTVGNGSGHDGYHVADYFDRDGRYIGPDCHGIEPMFAERADYGRTTVEPGAFSTVE